MYLNACAGCTITLGAPTGWDMYHTLQDEFPPADDTYPPGENPNKPFIMISGI